LDVGVMSRRSYFEIIADILRLGESSRTQILYGANISFDLLNKYLSLLAEQGFLTITKNGKHKLYRPTKKGENFLHLIEEVYRELDK